MISTSTEIISDIKPSSTNIPVASVMVSQCSTSTITIADQSLIITIPIAIVAVLLIAAIVFFILLVLFIKKFHLIRKGKEHANTYNDNIYSVTNCRVTDTQNVQMNKNIAYKAIDHDYI